MIDPELIEVKQHGKLFLKDIDFKCPACGCQFNCALKHIIEDANKKTNCEQLRCNIGHVIDEYPSLEDNKIRRVVCMTVPCPECAGRVSKEMVFLENERHYAPGETIPNENLL